MADVCKYGGPSVASRTNTPEFDKGWEPTFGPSTNEIRAPKRTRYVYRGGKCIEVGGPDDHGPEEQGEDARLHVVNDLYMDGTTVPGPNGPIDIGSRAKRRAYMTSPHPITGEPRELADMGDFKESWAAAERKRQAILDGSHGRERRRDSIGRILYEAEKLDRKQGRR